MQSVETGLWETNVQLTVNSNDNSRSNISSSSVNEIVMIIYDIT